MIQPPLRRIVLITGGGGFLGRHCLPLLVDEFDEVHSTTTQRQPSIGQGVHWHHVDLLHVPTVIELIAKIRPTHLLHLAWVTEHGRFWNSPANPRWLDASVQFVEAFATWGGKRVVTAGTCADYEWPCSDSLETFTRCAPTTLYGACKHALRLAVASFEVLSAAHTRIFHLYGPHEESRRLTPTVIQSLLNGRRAACTHGEQVRDFMYVKDAAAAHVKLLASDVRGPVNVASGRSTTIKEFVLTIGESLGRVSAIDFGVIPSPANDPAMVTADNTRLDREVGFQPEYSLEQGLAETVTWHQCSRHAPHAVAPSLQTLPSTSVISCPICESSTTVEFLHRTDVPVHQNLVFRDAASAKSVTRGTLAMRVCSNCGFVFNAAFDPSLLAYGEQYDNTQTCSPMFDDYVNELVRYLVEDCGVRGKQIVEVGCGKGTFLRRLIADVAAGNHGCGFDPTYEGPEDDLNGRLKFHRTFYDATCARVHADVVVCRHVIEHVPQPCSLLRTIREAMDASGKKDAQVFFETPCVDWIFRNEVVWDLFYEHCSLFTIASLGFAFARSGFRVSAARYVFGGQYLWLEATPASKCDPVVAPFVDRAIAYGDAERRLVAYWREIAERYASRGGVCIWGAGAKGVTFANLVDPTGIMIDCVVDLNPAKQGGFLPGTGHAIIAAEQLPARKVATALVLNPNYTAEIRTLLDRVAPHIETVDLMQSLSGRLRAA
jgi:nucleoside-diphosphate-sugar epimerase